MNVWIVQVYLLEASTNILRTFTDFIYLPCEGLDAQIPTDIHVTVKRKGTLVNSMIIPIVNTRRNGV